MVKGLSLKLPRYLTRQAADMELYNALSPGAELVCFYTGYRLSKTSKEEVRRIFNIEHIVPRAYFKIQPDLIENDLHNMMTTLHVANSLRGNYVYDMVARPSVFMGRNEIWFSSKAAERMVGTVSRFYPKDMRVVNTMGERGTKYMNIDADPSTLRCDFGKCKVEPLHRGAVARIIFYFIVLHYPRIDERGKMYFVRNFLDDGRLLKVLMRWDKENPIQNWEHARNQAIYKVQKNWNPLVGSFDESGKYSEAEPEYFRKIMARCNSR